MKKFKISIIFLIYLAICKNSYGEIEKIKDNKNKLCTSNFDQQISYLTKKK
jgi:hypothetical protein